jgi:hypothetical protein
MGRLSARLFRECASGAANDRSRRAPEAKAQADPAPFVQDQSKENSGPKNLHTAVTVLTGRPVTSCAHPKSLLHETITRQSHLDGRGLVCGLRIALGDLIQIGVCFLGVEEWLIGETFLNARIGRSSFALHTALGLNPQARAFLDHLGASARGFG